MTTKRAIQASKAGLPPGTLVYLGEQRVAESTVEVLEYGPEAIHEERLDPTADLGPFIDSDVVSWINVTGLHDTDLLQRTGERLGLHSLVLEDIAHLAQRPKLEDHGDYLFVVLQMLYENPQSSEVVVEQVSLVLTASCVVTFQEVEGDVFGAIRERIRASRGRIRTKGCDYLAYSLLDAVVDHYFVVLERMGDRVEQLQEDVIASSNGDHLPEIHRLRRQMVAMRRNLWPVRELVSRLEKLESELISTELAPFLRDVYEHTVQVIDSVELLREMLSSALEIYMTTVSNRMNEVMKVLTVIATIFIPLTFIAGVYGMNFEQMPELKWHFGYAAVWGVMGATVAGMLIFFRRKRWL